MLSSAQNFALGFFGYPIEGKYQQSITIEANGVIKIFWVQSHGNSRSLVLVQQYTLSIHDVCWLLLCPRFLLNASFM